MDKYATYIELTYGWYDSEKRESVTKDTAMIVMASSYADAVAQCEAYFDSELRRINRVEFFSSPENAIFVDIKMGRKFFEHIEKLENCEIEECEDEPVREAVRWNINDPMPAVKPGTVIYAVTNLEDVAP